MGLLTPRNFNNRKAKNMVYPSNSAFFTTTVGGMQLSYVSELSALQNTNVYSVINRIASDVASAHFKT